MLKVGLTGGIGSGKSVIIKIFQIFHIPVFVADDVAKSLLNDKKVIEFYSNLLGYDILENGLINKAKTAEKLFQNPHLIPIINSFIHPLVEEKFIKWFKNYKEAPYIIKESAILFETGLYFTILVISPYELRVRRLKENRGMTDEEIDKRMQVQWSDEKKIPLANHIITNDENHALLPQSIAIHQKLLELSLKKKI